MQTMTEVRQPMKTKVLEWHRQRRALIGWLIVYGAVISEIIILLVN